MEPFSPEERAKYASAQLSLVLSFFSRVDSRLALIVGVDISMVAFLASVLPPVNKWDAHTLITLLPAFCIGMSLYNAREALFPDLKGGMLEDGKTSLVFFGTVSKRSEREFIDAFNTQTTHDYARDLLGQVWRNSKILSVKFERLKNAFFWMLAALPAWLVALGVFANMNPSAKTFLR